MKSLRLDRWASQLQPPRNPRISFLSRSRPFSSRDTRPQPQRCLRQTEYQPSQPQWQSNGQCVSGRRKASSAAAAQDEDQLSYQEEVVDHNEETLPNFPLHRQASRSAKLAALHARLNLPTKFPLQTLARCLIDPSVDPRPGYNNAPFAILGQELLGYYTSEYLMCHYPRLPMPIMFAAQYAYVGPATLAAMRAEWGVEAVAAPGPEVDPGLLQLKRVIPGNSLAEDGMRQLKDLPQAGRVKSAPRMKGYWKHRQGASNRIVENDQFGDPYQDHFLTSPDRPPYTGAPISQLAENTSSEDAKEGTPSTAVLSQDLDMNTLPATLEAASAGFIRAVAGAVYMHAGTHAVKEFHKAHIQSRHLQLHTMFNFTHPTRDLSRLCDREGFEPPVARLISETGRLSRHPVFIVGVFSGNDKLGEGAGSSLNEGRVRAAAAALRSWYLYSPPDTDIVLPSEVEGAAKTKKKWKPQMVDMGEIVT